VSEKRCVACERPEPKNGRDMDGNEWMESPTRRVYCPMCYEVLFVRDQMLEVLDSWGKA
jgi:hypothetical protein